MTNETAPSAPVPGDVLSCGHVLQPRTGIGTGYARTSDGLTLCYACADDAQRRDMVGADLFVAYVASDGASLTTWSGGTLARTVPGVGGVARGFHGSKVYAWRFRAPDGSLWHGRNGGPGMAITVRRSKGGAS